MCRSELSRLRYEGQMIWCMHNFLAINFLAIEDERCVDEGFWRCRTTNDESMSVGHLFLKPWAWVFCGGWCGCPSDTVPVRPSWGGALQILRSTRIGLQSWRSW